MNKRYQVFVSSTYQDLQDERKEIMQALLELDCIPSGMELFPATNDDQWSLIKSVIDDSDYYIVVIGGRYGSIGPKDISYTEMEYRYALETGKPIIAFLHKNPLELPVNKTEREKDSQEKLESFKTLAKEKLVRYWTSPSDLGSVVSRSLTKLIKSNPAIGWIRADTVSDGGAAKEILKLKETIDKLKEELEQTKLNPPLGIEKFSRDEDEVDLEFTFRARNGSSTAFKQYRRTTKATWNEIFYHVGPTLMVEANEEDMISSINRLIVTKVRGTFSNEGLKGITNISVDPSVFQTIKIQFRVLGLISKNVKQRSVKDTASYWTLTPYGDDYLMTLRAVKRENS
ncbi:DUF4062 domain-containing protein [Paenibacillus sp. FSL L8-0463]|uniref:DUF4062 domain-containing protein n=1 Tax=Paenibacillus sp. FSL L8-0463 TaxID=2954687 RepID=UPI00311A8472